MPTQQVEKGTALFNKTISGWWSETFFFFFFSKPFLARYFPRLIHIFQVAAQDLGQGTNQNVYIQNEATEFVPKAIPGTGCLCLGTDRRCLRNWRAAAASAGRSLASIVPLMQWPSRKSTINCLPVLGKSLMALHGSANNPTLGWLASSPKFNPFQFHPFSIQTINSNLAVRTRKMRSSATKPPKPWRPWRRLRRPWAASSARWPRRPQAKRWDTPVSWP